MYRLKDKVAPDQLARAILFLSAAIPAAATGRS
jgi:hypothetical protein